MHEAGQQDFEAEPRDDITASSADDVTVDASAAPVKRKKQGMAQDPVVRGMALASIGLVILFLSMILGGLLMGVSAPDGPRTVEERTVIVSRAAVTQGTSDTGLWGTYIAALIDNGDYRVAERTIQEARESMSESTTAEFTLSEARLFRAQGKYQEAITLADKAMKMIADDVQRRLAAGGPQAQVAKIDGNHENYYEAALLKAYSYQELGQWDEAVESFDVYIGWKRGAADILVDRGNAKVEAGDSEGAEEDFKQALKFIPDSEEAKAGLARIGVSQ